MRSAPFLVASLPGVPGKKGASFLICRSLGQRPDCTEECDGAGWNRSECRGVQWNGGEAGGLGSNAEECDGAGTIRSERRGVYFFTWHDDEEDEDDNVGDGDGGCDDKNAAP